MSISALYILDLFGKPLISRYYRECPGSGIIGKFVLSLIEKEEDKSLTPVIQVGDTTLAFVKHKDIYVVCTTYGNANISLVFVFLYKIVRVMSDYFNEVVEESVRDNFVLIHELLDEVLDFGFPQTTDSDILMEYITQEGKKQDDKRTVPPAVTNAVSWRSEGIRYKKNELFLDVIESIDLMAHANGTIVSCEIIGSIRLKSQLSGMPELRLGLNDRLRYEKIGFDSERTVDLDEVRFHQCVRLSKFEADRDIAFIPPDGEFELMSYRLNSFSKPPIWVDCVTERYPGKRVQYTVKTSSNFKSHLTAGRVDILIPVPSDVDSPTFKVTTGVVNYIPEANVFSWTIKSFPGCKEFYLIASFGLPSVAEEEPDIMPPIRVRFEIAFWNLSGIHVQYLKVWDKSGYSAMPWVRYCTQDGDYQIRQREIVYGKI
uniref:MHD domain-containing protein n=1 Tax=Cuerna arida TaxID=1464854 RepID=A0A1B6FCG5_9HEMI